MNETVIPYPDPLQALTDELEAYYEKHGLRLECAFDKYMSLSMATVEELAEYGIHMTVAQQNQHVAYLKDFIERWDAAEEQLESK